MIDNTKYKIPKTYNKKCTHIKSYEVYTTAIMQTFDVHVKYCEHCDCYLVESNKGKWKPLMQVSEDDNAIILLDEYGLLLRLRT